MGSHRNGAAQSVLLDLPIHRAALNWYWVAVRQSARGFLDGLNDRYCRSLTDISLGRAAIGGYIDTFVGKQQEPGGHSLTRDDWFRADVDDSGPRLLHTSTSPSLGVLRRGHHPYSDRRRVCI